MSMRSQEVGRRGNRWDRGRGREEGGESDRGKEGRKKGWEWEKVGFRRGEERELLEIIFPILSTRKPSFPGWGSLWVLGTECPDIVHF